jgi:2,4-dienoyl-CoA reductase-like NADH-dependent reductase (Old Yellow Enzyme family)
MSSHLFSPVTMGAQTFSNRIVVSPMCQYSANDGCAADWHRMHLGVLAGSGAGLVMVEATAVERAGRITHACLGLYSDANESALAQTIAFCRTAGSAKLGIQLAHSGRKGSCEVPWNGGAKLAANRDPWPIFAPSAFGDGSVVACTQADLDRIKQAFVDAAVRAVKVGFDVIEIHAGHGYLLHQFLSSLANRRADQYGGELENRMRFPLDVFEAVRAVVPERIVVGARITGSDWVDGGITVQEAIVFARELATRGCDYVDVTSGGVAPAKIPVGPGYQVPFAGEIKKAVGICVRAVGMIVTAQQADDIIASGAVDAVTLARAFIDNPHWPYEAARVLGEELSYPPQYARAEPKLWPGSKLKK